MRHRILITRPKMQNDDATASTYYWADPVIREITTLGYELQDLKVKDATYENTSKSLKEYNPHVYIHFGHGCVANLIGQNKCVVTNGTQNASVGLHYINEYKYRLDDDIMCDLMCGLPANVDLLRNKIVIAYACHSAKRLGKCAMKNGARAYIGFDDYLIFMVDNKGSEGIFTEPILEFSYSMLNGSTLKESKEKTLSLFDKNIRKYKSYNSLAKLLLWDKKAFTVYGDESITIFK